jgi:iron complex outermembrane recepter protein
MSPTIQLRRRARAMSQATPVAAAVAALLCGAAAQAQQAAPAGDVVTITGIRRGIESAISVKKNADGVVEAISAEDIGKLPDTTIAESLARLPGVTAQRDSKGRATNINIRGLGNDFNGYLLNGREQTSTGDSRAVDMSVYPAELIAGATVYKTQSATLMTAGLAGTIDNLLIDPLAFPGRVIAGQVSGTKSGVGLPVEGKGKRYSLSYIDQFADRKLGIALGFVHSDDDSSSLVNGSWGNSPTITTTGGGTVTGVNVPFGGGLGFETDHVTDKRDGVAAIVAFKPNKVFTSQLDLYYAKIKTGTKKVKVNRGSNGGAITNATVNGGVVESGTFTMNPGDLIVYSENIFDDDKIESLGWKNTLKLSDTFRASLDLSHNKAKRVEKDIEVYGQNAVADTLSFTNGGAATPSFSVGNPLSYTDRSQIAVQDVSGWSGVTYPSGPYAGQTVPQAGYSKGPTITDKLDAVRLDFTQTLGGAFTDVQFGLNFSKRSKERVTDEGLVVSAGNGGYDRIPYPAGAYVENNVGGTGLNVLTFDPQDGLWAGAALLRKFNDDILSKTWTVQEKVSTAYAKFNFDTEAGSTPIRGNVGVQIVNTDQSSGGFRAGVSSGVTLTNPATGLTTNGKKYTDFLPSVNLSADMGGGNVLRLGAGIQIARPTLTDMRNSFALAEDTSPQNATFGRLVGSSGNPALKPFKAKALDLSWEKYFGTKAYLSSAVFYKQLDTYIVPQSALYDFTTLAGQVGVGIPALGPVGLYTTTTNGQGGRMFGTELTASIPMNLVTPVLNGFGFTTSYSYTDSSVSLPDLIGLNPSQQVPNTGRSMSLPGLSRHNAKLMLYFERAGFSAFVADNYRSGYVGYVNSATVGGYPSPINIAAQSWVSAQVGYEFQEGILKGLGFRFEGNNLNKPTYREIKADGSNNKTEETGASYYFKLTYKYQ